MTLKKEIDFEQKVNSLIEDGQTIIQLLVDDDWDQDWGKYLMDNYHSVPVMGGMQLNLERKLTD